MVEKGKPPSLKKHHDDDNNIGQGEFLSSTLHISGNKRCFKASKVSDNDAMC